MVKRKLVPLIGLVLAISVFSCDTNTTKEKKSETTITENVSETPVPNENKETEPEDIVDKITWDKDNKFSKNFQKKGGDRLIIEFENTGDIKNIHVKVTPEKTDGNIRISEIELPDGSTDGPFTDILNLKTSQKGIYKLTISESKMNGEPYEGAFIVQAEKK